MKLEKNICYVENGIDVANCAKLLIFEVSKHFKGAWYTSH